MKRSGFLKLILYRRRGATLIELITTIVIISILAAVSAGILISVLHIFIYLPKQLKTRMVGQEVINAVCEGESGKWGIRYSTEILDASDDQFTYSFGYPVNNDKRNIRFKYDGVTKKIYRYCTAFGDPVTGTTNLSYGAAELIPYYATGDITIIPQPDIPLFSYFKQDGSAWISGTDPLYELRRVEIAFIVKSGTGIFEKWESAFTVTSGVEIKRYISISN